MRWMFLYFLLCLQGCSLIDLDTASIHTGYTFGAIKGDDIDAVPASLRTSWNVSRIVGLDPHYGKIQIGLEGYIYGLVEPDGGVITGLTPLLRYTYLFTDYLGAYVEGGAGPAYLSIDTYEQEASGFSFFDQIGGGFEIHPSSSFSFLLGYRFAHISHGGILNTRNRGIETNSFLFGIAIKIP